MRGTKNVQISEENGIFPPLMFLIKPVKGDKYEKKLFFSTK